MANETKVDTETTEKNEEVDTEADTEEVDTEVDTENKDNDGVKDTKSEKPKLSIEDEEAMLRGRLARNLKKQGKTETKTFSESKQEKSNEPDYARLAYLKAEGISHPDDQKIVQDEALRLKLSLTDVLQMEHIKNRLQTNQNTRTSQAGMPKGKGRTGGTTQHDVDYWLAKGETPDDQELAEKVIDARIGKEKKNKFSDELFTG